MLPRDERALQKAQRGAAPDTAGKQWFDLPATAITDEVKRDLRMLRLRWAPLKACLGCRSACQRPTDKLLYPRLVYYILIE